MNKYIVNNDTTEIIIESIHGKYICLIDTKNIDKVSKYTWSIEGVSKKRNNLYVSYRGRKIKSLKIHRLIMNCPVGLQVDHINGDRLNNLEANLRICTEQQNHENLPIISNRNKSCGLRNITWDKSKKRWQVIIKGIFIGRYKEIKDAMDSSIVARKIILPFNRR